MRVLLLLGLSILVTACMPTSKPEANNALITKTSPFGVEKTMDRLEAAVTAKGATVFARVNHAAGAQNIGEVLAPMEVLIFGNPKLGTPLLQADPRIGLDLPIKVLVWDQDGTTQIAFLNPSKLGIWYGLEPNHPTFIKMRGILEVVTKEAVTE